MSNLSIPKTATAQDIMSPNPVSVRAFLTVPEAIHLLSEKGISAVPVVDAKGRPVGVLSQTDIVRYDREKVEYVSPQPDYYQKAELSALAGEATLSGFTIQKVDTVRVSEIMTPLVFCVAPELPLREVVAEMLRRKIHRVFVTDENDVLSGVISVLDILRHLQD